MYGKKIIGLGGVTYSKFYDTIEKYHEKKGKKSSLPKGLYNRQEAIDSLWNSYKNKKNWTSQQMLNYGGTLIPKLNKITGLGGVKKKKNKTLTYKDFVQMTKDNLNKGSASDEYVSDKRIKKDAKFYYNLYLKGESLDEIFGY